VGKLKQKAVKGFFWNAIDGVASQGINFVVIILLGRVLSPTEFGLVALTGVFVAIAQVFVDGGLNYALIRKLDCTNKDYSVAFYFNTVTGIIFYFFIFFIAPFVAQYYELPVLCKILRIISLGLVISSLTGVQQTILIKRVDFKSQAIISLISALSSGGIAVYMVYHEWGVWALVWRLLLSQGFRSILLWVHNKWLPLWEFDKKSFWELFRFGYKIIFIYLMSNISRNIYNNIIGKSYSVEEAGSYNMGDQYAYAPGGLINQITTRVSYPVFSLLQNDTARLKRVASQTMQSIMFITSHIMFFIALITKPLIVTLMGSGWETSAIYLQALCLAYFVLPLHSINQNIMNALGRSDLFLKTDLIKYTLFIPIVFVGISWGLPVLIAGYIFHFWLGFFINAWFAKKLIDYSILQQIKDILPSISIALCSVCIAELVFFYIDSLSNWIQIVILMFVYFSTSLLLCVSFRPMVYKEFLQLIKTRFQN
jgi:O-antigen/teichoic acid export membrane protein